MSARLTLSAAAIMAMAVAGCSPEMTLHAYDKAPMQALEKYAPEYVLDNNGRVVRLKLERKQLDAAAFENLSNLTALRGLSLHGSTIPDTGLERLQNIGQLRSLGLGATALTDRGLSHLTKLPRLRWLWVSGARGFTREGVEHLKRAKPRLVVFQ